MEDTVEGILGSPHSTSSPVGVGRRGSAQKTHHRRSPTPLPPLFEGGFLPYRLDYSHTPSVMTPSPKSEKSDYPGWAFPALVLERPEPFHIFALTAEGGQPGPEQSDQGEGDRQPQQGTDTGAPDEGETPPQGEETSTQPVDTTQPVNLTPPQDDDQPPSLTSDNDHPDLGPNPALEVGWGPEPTHDQEGRPIAPWDWPNDQFRVNGTLIDRDTWTDPNWAQDRDDRVMCEACRGFWWRWNHPYAMQRQLEAETLPQGPGRRDCPNCKGVAVGDHRLVRFVGRGWHEGRGVQMVYLGGGFRDGQDDQGRKGLWIWNLPLYNFTYPGEALFRPWINGEYQRHDQLELPRVIRRAEYDFLPTLTRDWMERKRRANQNRPSSGRGSGWGGPDKRRRTSETESWEGESEWECDLNPTQTTPQPPRIDAHQPAHPHPGSDFDPSSSLSPLPCVGMQISGPEKSRPADLMDLDSPSSHQGGGGDPNKTSDSIDLPLGSQFGTPHPGPGVNPSQSSPPGSSTFVGRSRSNPILIASSQGSHPSPPMPLGLPPKPTAPSPKGQAQRRLFVGASSSVGPQATGPCLAAKAAPKCWLTNALCQTDSPSPPSPPGKGKERAEGPVPPPLVQWARKTPPSLKVSPPLGPHHAGSLNWLKVNPKPGDLPL